MKQLTIIIFAMLITLAGFSQTTPVVVATQVTLTGSGTDSDGTIVSYQWKQVSGPANPTIVTPNAATTIIKDYSVAGVYIYQLLVTDNQGATGFAEATVTVLSPNKPPIAVAGANITIQLPK